MENRHTAADLAQMQSLPLDIKVSMTKRRIEEWYDAWDGNVYISFSGGKDSTVLLDIARSIYPAIKGVFYDTGLEFPQVRAFVRSFENIDMARPAIPFVRIVRKYGYPIISKEVSQRITDARSYIDRHKAELQQAIGLEEPNIFELSWEAAKWSSANAYFWNVYQPGCNSRTGLENPRTDRGRSYMNLARYLLMLDAPFRVDSRCCTFLKKNLASRYSMEHGGAKPITATMADESARRRTSWLVYGCNRFDAKHPKSSPMSFWKQTDVLEYIRTHGLKIASVYGDVIEDGGGRLKCTGCERTGCFACGFGLQHSSDRRR